MGKKNSNSRIIETANKFLTRFSIVKAFFIRLFGLTIIRYVAYSKGIKTHGNKERIDFIMGDKIIRVNRKHLIYSLDIINSFDYYHSAVVPIGYNGFKLVDYSTQRYHDVIGYDKHPIFFPSFSEPVITTEQYLEFSKIKPNSIVLDLGAYAGLTSILFKEIVGPNGKVIAVDADEQNITAQKINFSLYKKITGNTILTLNGAVWIHENGLEFSTEGNMGSSAVSVVGKYRGILKTVPSFTLTSIAKKFELKNIDFIKCDVEGAESVIFEDHKFFELFKPRIIIETHIVNNIETTGKVIEDLEKYGYRFKKIHQTGVTLPLLECYPPED